MITGSSDGMGEEYAYQFSNQGFNIILISRTQKKLEKVRENILMQNPSCKVVIIQADFESNSNVPYFESTVMDKIKDYDIGIAMVNAGVFPLGMFDELTNREI